MKVKYYKLHKFTNAENLINVLKGYVRYYKRGKIHFYYYDSKSKKFKNAGFLYFRYFNKMFIERQIPNSNISKILKHYEFYYSILDRLLNHRNVKVVFSTKLKQGIKHIILWYMKKYI